MRTCAPFECSYARGGVPHVPRRTRWCWPVPSQQTHWRRLTGSFARSGSAPTPSTPIQSGPEPWSAPGWNRVLYCLLMPPSLADSLNGPVPRLPQLCLPCHRLGASSAVCWFVSVCPSSCWGWRHTAHASPFVMSQQTTYLVSQFGWSCFNLHFVCLFLEHPPPPSYHVSTTLTFIILPLALETDIFFMQLLHLYSSFFAF